MLPVRSENSRIWIGDRFSVSFQRTLRIPDDGRTYPLPPGLGAFPIFKASDYQNRLPPDWIGQGSWFVPMYQREAMWLGFSSAAWKPNAVKVGVGGVNAVSGEEYGDTLHDSPQDYLVCPPQPWLDGINSGTAVIRQFVAMPLGQGYTIEASFKDREESGGIQISVFEPKPGKFPDAPPPLDDRVVSRSLAMGLGAGGTIKQKIYPDPYGIETWDQQNYGRVFVHIVNIEQFTAITGMEAPPPPIDAHTYTQHGLPWFDLYDDDYSDVPAPENLKATKTISERDAEIHGEGAAEGSLDLNETQIKKLHRDQ